MTPVSGVNLEFTGELSDEGFSVTECLGGSMKLSEEGPGLRYQSFCDGSILNSYSMGHKT